MIRDFDLFGKPLPRNLGKSGRNEHVASAENVSRVRGLVIAGWTSAQIAEELGISRPTLRKHYLPDIEKARVVALGELKAKVVMQLELAAEGGNVAAMKELLRLVERGELAQGIGARPVRTDEPRAEKLGKKEQQLRDAHRGHEATAWNDLLH